MDFIVILLITYFIGRVPIGYLIKSRANIKIWFENDEDVGIFKIHRLLGMEWAILLLAGYFFKGYLGLLLANHLWGNSFINLMAAGLLILGQDNTRFSNERGGLMPSFLGILYCWNLSLAGALASVWLATYLLSRKVDFSSFSVVASSPFVLYFIPLDVDLGIFTLYAALFVLKNHILTIRMRIAERVN